MSGAFPLGQSNAARRLNHAGEDRNAETAGASGAEGRLDGRSLLQAPLAQVFGGPRMSGEQATGCSYLAVRPFFVAFSNQFSVTATACPVPTSGCSMTNVRPSRLTS